MANPITKILHFAEEIQNVHSAGSPIEVTECDPTPTPTPEQATPTPEQATPTPIAQDQETPTPINDGGGVVDDNTAPSNCHQGGHPDIIAYSTLTGSVGQTEVHVWDQVQASWNKKGDTIDNLTNVVSSHDGNVLVGKIDGYSIQSFHWEDNTWKPKGNPISIGPFHLPASYPVNPSSGTPEKRAVSDVSISDDGNVIAYSTGNNQTQQNSDGEVYVFEWTGTEWTQKGSTMRRTGWTWPASGQSNDPHGFGASIKLSGDGNSIGVGIVVWGQFRLYTYTTDWVMVDSRGEGQITTGILPSYSGTSIDVSCSGRFMAATVPIKRAVADSDGNPRYTSAIYWASNDTTADNYFGQNMSADIFSEIGGIGTHYGHGLQQTWAYDARHTMAYSVTESKTGNISSATIAYVIPSDDPEYQYDYNNHDADLHGDTPHLLKVFERTWGTEWTQKGESIKLYGINMETNATLSIDMSDDGNTIVVVNSTGSIFNSGFDKNAIDVYDWSSCTWTKRASITPSEAVQTASISYVASTGIPSYHSSCQTPTPIGSIPAFTAENLCQYESGRFEDFSKTSICVRKEERDLFGLPNTSSRYFKVDGEYVFDGMENGKPKYRRESEYGIGTIIYRENYNTNSAGYTLRWEVKEPYYTLALNSGASRALSTNAGSNLQTTDFYNYTKLKNKEYPWCHWTTIDPVPYTLATEDNPCDFPTPTPTSVPVEGSDTFSANLLSVNKSGVNPNYKSAYGYYIANDQGKPVSGKIIWSDVTTNVGEIYNSENLSKDNVGFFVIPNAKNIYPSLQNFTDITFQPRDIPYGAGLSQTQEIYEPFVNGLAVFRAISVTTPSADGFTAIFYSDPHLNWSIPESDGLPSRVTGGRYIHMQNTSADGNQNWEDILGGGDQDNNDINLQVDWVTQTPTPTEEPSLSGDDVNELEFRWADGIVADEKILQVKNLLKPTHSDNGVGNFDDRDMSAWSTLYTSNQNEDNHDLSSAFWPDAAVDENYTFAKTIDFENARIILDDTDLLPNNEVSNLNYYQLYIDFDNSNADLEPTTNTGNTIQPLYIYFGDTTDPEASASGKTQFNSVITKMATATSTSESASGTKVIEISNSDTTKFKAGMNVIISPDNDAIREENVIKSLGSLNLQNNLQNTHPSGSSVVQKPSSASANGGGSTTPTPSSSPSPNECDGLSAKRCYSPYAGWNYVRSTPSANGNCYRGCTQCEDDTRPCGDNTKEQGGDPLKRSYNLGCGFPECECNETVQNFWNGAQYDPSPQDKTYTRVNETECKVDKPTCSQANKTITKAAAEDACEDACNGRDVVWNDDICAWECAKADVCDAAKRNCLEQNPPECGNNMNGQNTKSGGDKTLNQQTCEWEDCECIDLDNNNDDHKCFDKDGNFTEMKTLNDQCEFEDCCEETYIPSDCANNKVKKVNTDCTEGPCECVKDEVDDPGCGLAAVGHGPEHSVWDQALCSYTCECDWDFIEQQEHNKTMINDCNDTPNKKVSRNETNCTLECICNPELCPEGKQGTLNNDTCEYENCECTEQPDNTTQMCADGTTQQTWDDTECKWTPDCPDVACGPDQHPEWKLPNGDPCNPSVATLKTFFGLSMNLNNVWENVFDGLSIKFGEQETANGVDYLPIYAKVDNDKMALSSGNNISEWNKLFIFVGDNKSPNNHANGEGIEFDTIVSDDLMLFEQHTNSISAKIHFRFANINGIPTLQIKNILKPTNSAFENRDTENDWSSVYVGLGYNLNDDVWPTASVDVNYEIGPMTYSSTDCQEYCVDDPTPTPVDYIEGGGT